MMKPVLYLHIGMNKTGTSAIQQFLTQNCEQLKSLGLLFPSTGRDECAHYGLSAALGFAHARAQLGPRQKPVATKLRQALEQEVKAFAAQQVILSSEDFVLPKAVEPVKEFLAAFDVRIVVYLRRHDCWFESAYTQAVKTVAMPPYGRGVRAYVRHRTRRSNWYGDYRLLLDRWAGAFGRENIIVRPYETEQNQPSLVADFMRAVGQEGVLETLNVSLDRVNERLSHKGLLLTEYFQRVDVPHALRKRLLVHARSAVDDETVGSLLSPTIRRQFVDKYLDDYEYIAREYLGRDDGKLFHAPLPDADAPWVEPPSLSPVNLIEETLKALGAAE